MARFWVTEPCPVIMKLVHGPLFHSCSLSRAGGATYCFWVHTLQRDPRNRNYTLKPTPIRTGVFFQALMDHELSARNDTWRERGLVHGLSGPTANPEPVFLS